MIKKQFLIFLIIGVANTLIGLTSTYICFDFIKLNYWLATFAGNLIGMVVSYTLNKKYTFKNTKKVTSSLLKFFLVVFLCYYISYWFGLRLTHLIVDFFVFIRPYVGEVSILLGAGLYTISNFLGQRFLVFNSKKVLNSESF
jgi:putative flippase GtrA